MQRRGSGHTLAQLAKEEGTLEEEREEHSKADSQDKETKRER